MPKGRERNRERAIARNARPKPWGELPRGDERAEGLLLIDKDKAVTSHDVVGALRRLGATRQVGHAGTLDPMATGLLVIALGRATKLIQYLMGATKTYEARICLGIGSDTDDADGVLYPAALGDVTESDVDAAIADLTGDLMQVPATVSAIKVEGKRAHDLAREGHEVELAARPVHVARFERVTPLRSVSLEIGNGVEFDVVVTASAGTYVRALARDLGRALGSAAHLRSLRRTHIGHWSVESANSVLELRHTVEAGQSLPVLSIGQVCREIFPAIAISEDEAVKLGHGLFIDQRDPVSSGSRAERWPMAAFCGDRPIALVSKRQGKLKPDLQLHTK